MLSSGDTSKTVDDSNIQASENDYEINVRPFVQRLKRFIELKVLFLPNVEDVRERLVALSMDEMPDVMVVGGHYPHIKRREVRESIASHLMHHANCPILVVCKSQDAIMDTYPNLIASDAEAVAAKRCLDNNKMSLPLVPIKRIAVGFDGGESSKHALVWSITHRFIERTDDVRIVHIPDDIADRRAKQAIQDAVAELQLPLDNCRVEFLPPNPANDSLVKFVMHDKTGDDSCSTAGSKYRRAPDLLIIGNHQKFHALKPDESFHLDAENPYRSLPRINKNTASFVLHHAKCPVLIVNNRGDSWPDSADSDRAQDDKYLCCIV
eukprot:gene5260-6394_t